MAEEQFGDWIKAVVDVSRGIMAIGGDLHADDEAALLADGSRQRDLWGINLYPGESGGDPSPRSRGGRVPGCAGMRGLT